MRHRECRPDVSTHPDDPEPVHVTFSGGHTLCLTDERDQLRRGDIPGDLDMRSFILAGNPVVATDDGEKIVSVESLTVEEMERRNYLPVRGVKFKPEPEACSP